MIKLVDIKNHSCKDNLFLIRAKSNFLCYEKFDFCNTFFQELNGNKTAFINILSGNATVFCENNADFDELRAFFAMHSPKNIFCNKTAFEKLGKKPFTKGFIMKYFDNKNTLKTKKSLQSISFNPNYKADYNILKQYFAMPLYNDFVSDLSYRLNRGSACVIENDFGVAISLYQTDKKAVISALAVDITKQNQGIGTYLLQSIIKALENKTIYIYCKDEKTKRFYEKNGFVSIDEYYFLEDFLK